MAGPVNRDKLKDVLTTGEVARLCHVAPRTVSKWFDSGSLRGYRIPGSKDRRIPRDQLVRFMKAHGMPVTGLENGMTTVLLVDQDEQLNRLVGEALTAEGHYSVREAASAFEAGVIVANERPRVVVIDVTLPDVDPRRICQTLRTHPDLADIRLVAVSGALTEGQGQSLLEEGFAAFLPKPFDLRQLRGVIDSLD